MQTVRHYWYIFALVFSLLLALTSLLLGGWRGGQFVQTSRSASSLARITGGPSSPISGTGGSPSPTSGTSGAASGTPSPTSGAGGSAGSTSSPTSGTSGAVGGPSSSTSGTSGAVGSPPTYRPGGYLIIPSIGVNAPIEPVGVSADGDLAVPTQQPWDGVGWYQNGPYPGAQGSAVIDGHLDRPGGSPAVFWNLRNLHIGDIVMVVNPGEKSLYFRVIN